jgi:predicted alpha/beta-fold hydrolase
MTDDLFPPFRPHPLFRGGHLQTLAGAWWRAGGMPSHTAALHWVELPDGDRLALHDDVPAGWSSRHPAALLVHGLAGCHRSGYMVRIAAKLAARGVRAFRLDLRGCGAGRGYARLPYHAGRSGDVQTAVEMILRLCPSSPLLVVGFSLGGNIVLKWLGESGASLPAAVQRGMAVNPPVDLAVCTRRIEQAARGAYDRHFTRLLYRQVRDGRQWADDSPLARARRAPRNLVEFDDLFTAPLSGFGDAANYYRRASSSLVIPDIRLPTLILSAADDPLIPVETLTSLPRPSQVRLQIAAGGGHLGYYAARSADPDRRWLDWRVVEWLTAETR